MTDFNRSEEAQKIFKEKRKPKEGVVSMRRRKNALRKKLTEKNKAEAKKR